MESIRKWFYKPKRGDRSLLAQFFYADEALNLVAAELDSFDGRKDPERCTALVNHLRQCQDKVLTICNRIMDDVIPFERADRDFRVKFPDDVMQENLAGQLWFGAECLAAGSSIMNREAESAGMRPLAKAVTKALENVRNLLREQCLRGGGVLPAESERLAESLKILDRLFAEFELCYVSAMVPVKSSKEYELHQLVVVLFSETLQRALEMRLLTQDMVDTYDPALMFTIPRLAIVSGLLVFPESPLCLDRTPADMSEMFRPFRTLLLKIRELLWTLTKRELYTLEKLLCSSEEINTDYIAPKNEPNNSNSPYKAPDLDDFVSRFYSDYPNCKDFVSDLYAPPDDGALASWENSDSDEDDTEWAGEASECDTIVTGRSVESSGTEENTVGTTPLDGLGRSMELSETEPEVVGILNERRKSSLRLKLDCADCAVTSTQVEKESMSDVVVDDEDAPCDSLEPNEGNEPCSSGNVSDGVAQLEPKELAQLIEELMNDDGKFFPADNSQTAPSEIPESSMLAYGDDDVNNLTPATSSPSSVSETIEIRTGFLLANKMAQTSLEEDVAPPPELCAESLPDGDSKEAMSVATATLSTLLLSNSSNSPENSFGSPLDSGLGTVISCSDVGSFSDQSPDTLPPSTSDQLNQSLPEAIVQEQSTDSSESICNKSEYQIRNCESDNAGNNETTFDVRVTNNDGLNIRNDNVLLPLNTPFINVSRNSDITNDSSVLNSVPTVGTSVGGYTKPKSQISDLEDRTSDFDEHLKSSQDALCRADVLKGSNSISAKPSDKERMGKGRGYKKGYRGQGGRLAEERSYAGNWDTLVKQHSRKVGAGTRVRTRRRLQAENDANNLTNTNESESSFSSTCSSCRSSLTANSLSDSCSVSSETSSFNSECQDDEEIALAMQAAEIANRNETRAKFRSSEDLVHRLFVCVAGVADQLQTNFAGDLRHILKCVFQINNSADEEEEGEGDEEEETPADEGNTTNNDLCRNVENAEEALGWDTPPPELTSQEETTEVETPPPWVPDDLAPRCMSCDSGFTVVRRRHHCRNCGKVFCARCSSNTVALPRYGHAKPVRVCNRCFLYQVTPFTIDQIAAHS